MEKQPVVLIAASGLAREVLATVDIAGTAEVVGVLDDDSDRHGTDFAGFRVAGDTSSATTFDNARFIICAGTGAARARIAQKLAVVGICSDRFATVIHPTASIGRGCKIGYGSIVLAQATLTADVIVGGHCVLMPQVVLTHDNHIEDFVTLGAGVVLGGCVRIGTGAYLGMSSSVRQGLRIGPQAVLGMGAVLLRDLPTGETWAGVPAAPLSLLPVGGQP